MGSCVHVYLVNFLLFQQTWVNKHRFHRTDRTLFRQQYSPYNTIGDDFALKNIYIYLIRQISHSQFFKLIVIIENVIGQFFNLVVWQDPIYRKIIKKYKKCIRIPVSKRLYAYIYQVVLKSNQIGTYILDKI